MPTPTPTPNKSSPNRPGPDQRPQQPRLILPDAAFLVAGITQAAWLSTDGVVETLGSEATLAKARGAPPVLCHRPATARRLGVDPFPAFDLLELFAFVRPASFVTPTPRGLARLFGLPPPAALEEEAIALREVALALLAELAARGEKQDPTARDIAWAMTQSGWCWGPPVLAALGVRGTDGGPDQSLSQSGRGLAVWRDLPEWEERAPAPPAGNRPVSAEDARNRLSELLGEEAEARPQQADYASAVAQAFLPRDDGEEARLVLAEAGTGVGKTLGYIAAASRWAELNQAPVWISTFTRNLQHQVDAELDRLYPEPQEKSERVVVRKGRENYLCLLNFQEAVQASAQRPHDGVAVGLMARWAARTRNGDMVGGDFPGWLPDLIGHGRTLGLTDRRGECIYGACTHYSRCFIERGIRRARHASLVVANHALVMSQATAGGDEARLPTRYVFDEGHHVFDAADNAFAAHLSGRETYELRRWLLGADGRSLGASRIRGLRRRLEDLVAGDDKTAEALEVAMTAARGLTSEAWQQRLATAAPLGPTEAFLSSVREQVYARAGSSDSPYSLETDAKPPIPELLERARALDRVLERLVEPLRDLQRRLAKRLDAESDHLDSDSRRRIEACCRSLERRALIPLDAWRQMLDALDRETPEAYVDWFAVERIDGRDSDVGYYRHWIDPTIPFAKTVIIPAQGVAITSATLTDGSGEPEADWAAAEMRTGASHLSGETLRARVPSPFDYGAQARVFIVNDVRRDDMDQVAAAYRTLFLAAEGGGLGLFTAIARLRAVHKRIAAALEELGLPLYAQHVDRLDTATLVDIFRSEERSCLLGTDAVRDGVDVPGRALRLIVFDRVPWPRPDIRHRARREAFGGRAYDDRLTRLRLKQAFGRLVRKADDKGVFVLLDARMPSRLLGAFPEAAAVEKTGLAEVAREIRTFLATGPSGGGGLDASGVR